MSKKRCINFLDTYSRYARRPIYLQTGSLRLTLQDGSQKPPKNRGCFSSYISRAEHAVNSEQTSYYSFVHKMTVAACFNFIGATKADLQTALLDLLFPPLQDDHQVSLPNSIPDRFFWTQIHVTTSYRIDLCENRLRSILQLPFPCYHRSNLNNF